MRNNDLKWYTADLHIHTCLSPCADWAMSPIKIVEKSRKKGIDIIAICDHNSAENAEAVINAGKKKGLCVLPGMEICSREEVHILSIFERLEQAVAMQEYVYSHLEGVNNPEVWGYQVVADENDKVIYENPKLLIGATTLGLGKIADMINLLDGISIAAHIDRRTFGIISQLGFIPIDLQIDGVEISSHITVEEALEKIPDIGNKPCFASSDAHFPDDIGKANTRFFIMEPAFAEIRLAIQKKKGRRMEA
ncbi:MAG: PHP domain-containing protein [Deltaproteobacteria bacterium]|nr:PHP domain-containing protein [Deltaproteobacteria bacterium]